MTPDEIFDAIHKYSTECLSEGGASLDTIVAKNKACEALAGMFNKEEQLNFALARLESSFVEADNLRMEIVGLEADLKEQSCKP